MKPWKRKLLEVAVLGAFLLTITAPVTKPVWSQQAPIRGEVSAGVYENIKTDGAQHLQTVGAGVTYSQVQLTATSTTSAVVAANLLRKFLFIQNNDAANAIYVAFGTSATSTVGVKLSSGQSWQITNNPPTQSVNLITGNASSVSSIIYIEGQ